MDEIEEQRELMSMWTSALRLSKGRPRLAAWQMFGAGCQALLGTEQVDPRELVDLVYLISRDNEVE